MTPDRLDSLASRALLAAGLAVATGKPPPTRLFRATGELSSPKGQEELLVRAIRHKLVPILDAQAEALDLEPSADLRALSEVFRIVSEHVYGATSPLLEALEREGVRVQVIKGADLDCSCYPRSLARMMIDVDLLVRRPELGTVREILSAAGFIQGELDKESLVVKPLPAAVVAQLEAEHYEIGAFRKIVRVPALSPYAEVIARHVGFWEFAVVGEDVYFTLNYDVHHNLSISFDVRDLWVAPRPLTLPDGHQTLAQNHSDQVWFFAARMYHEVMMHGAPAMRLFIDLLILLHQCGSAIDWKRVMSMTEKYSLHPSLFYTLSHAQELLGPVVPAWVLAACDPASETADRAHDWGDFIPRLLHEAPRLSPLLDTPEGGDEEGP